MTRAAISAAVLLLTAMFSVPAFADCASQCAYAYGGYGSYNYTTCYHLQCEKPKTAYGALAFGAQSLSWGDAWGKSSAAAANQTALQSCLAHGNDCKLVSSFSNTCGAVAAVEAKHAFMTGLGRTQNAAQNAAMTSCQSKIGGKCEIEVWACAGP
jgi:hypothetical protein